MSTREVRWTRSEIRRIYSQDPDEVPVGHKWTMEELREMYVVREEDSDSDETVVPDSEDVVYEQLILAAQEMKTTKIGHANWVIETLLFLAQNRKKEVTKELFAELLTMWKKIENRQVLAHLVDKGFLNKAENILKTSTDRYLKELVLTIVRDTWKDAKGMRDIRVNENLMMILFDILTCGYIGAVNRAVLLLEVLARDMRSDPDSSVFLQIIRKWKDFGDVIAQNLIEYKSNKELLVNTMELIYVFIDTSVDDKCLLKEFFNTQKVIHGLVTSYLTVHPDQMILQPLTLAQFVERWLEVFFKILQLDGTAYKGEHSNEFRNIIKILLNILRPYKEESNLKPMKEMTGFIILQCLEVLIWFKDRKEVILAEMNVVAAIVLDSLSPRHIDFTKTSGHDELRAMLTNLLNLYWFKVFINYTVDEISEIVSLCNPEVVLTLADSFKYCEQRLQFVGPEKIAQLKVCLGIES